MVSGIARLASDQGLLAMASWVARLASDGSPRERWLASRAMKVVLAMASCLARLSER